MMPLVNINESSEVKYLFFPSKKYSNVFVGDKRSNSKFETWKVCSDIVFYLYHSLFFFIFVFWNFDMNN